MFDSLVKSVESVFVEFNLRRLGYLIFVLAVFLGGIYLFDQATDYSFYSRYVKKLDALERLQAINSAGVPESLSPIYESLAKSLNEHKEISVSFEFSIDPIIKIISASAVFWMLFLMGLIQKIQGVSDWYALVIGGFIFAIATSSIAVVIPIIHSIWVNALINATFQTVVILMMMAYGNKNKRS